MLSTAESTLSPVEREIKKILKKVKRSPYALYRLWSAADYLDCPFVYNSCLNHLFEKTKNHLASNRIGPALELVALPMACALCTSATNYSETYKPLRNFLTHVSKQQHVHEETNDWYSWDGQDTIMFKTLDSAPETNIKYWFDGKTYIIPTKID